MTRANRERVEAMNRKAPGAVRKGAPILGVLPYARPTLGPARTAVENKSLIGCYGCVSGKGFVPAAIKLFTRSRVSHAFVVVSDSEVVEAWTSGARVAPLEQYLKRDAVFNDMEPLTDTQRKIIVDTATTFIGRPYGFLDIVALGLRESFDIRWKWLKRMVHNSHRMICSQLVAEAYRSAGIDVCPGRHPEDVTPGGLAWRLTIHAWTLRKSSSATYPPT